MLVTCLKFGVGDDDPTRQRSSNWRAIPGLIDLRPGDPNKVAEAWHVIMQLKHEPVVLILSRQNLPTLDRNKYASATLQQKFGFTVEHMVAEAKKQIG